MEIGISADAYRRTITVPESIERIAGIGFDAIDMAFCDWSGPDGPLAAADWRGWIDAIGAAAEANRIGFSQAHAPIYPYFDVDPARDEFLDRMTERTFTACEVLGIPWVAFHARFRREGYVAGNRTETRERNARWFDRLATRGRVCGVSVAIENMFDFDDGRTSTYVKHAEEILDLIEAVGRDNLGACLDTGHANVAGSDPAAMVRTLGARLAVLHVHDNDGRSDQHVAPFVGTIDWPALVEALRDTGYGGVFSLEVHCQVQRMPPAIIDAAVRLVHRIGRHLVG